jgi:glutathione S-transferase
MTIDYVSLDAARAARGTRIVTSALVPSPWSEAAKGLFAIAELPALVVARGRDAADFIAWTGVDNVPVVLHDDEPARTNWSAIVGLVARLAAPGAILPVDPAARAADMGLLEMIAGEQGLGWNGRLAMIHTSFESNGARGFPLPIATYLSKRYGYTPAMSASVLRERVARQLELVAARLAGSTYFGGQRPCALDVYVATFLTPLSVIDDSVCPQISTPARAGFAAAHDLFRDLVQPALTAHRAMMFERHLSWPIRLS